jgi:hypothetical protein
MSPPRFEKKSIFQQKSNSLNLPRNLAQLLQNIEIQCNAGNWHQKVKRAEEVLPNAEQ